ncbi:hypothetical protein CALVIDRAFT_597114 [Calocera viscosa TUFC12733]|uniref:Uncharacterized protein n=1 Tax=Calocera viscosa (strain TUFC12733) TaxID=1330018 RepID=A0A167NVD2_CALVF|nr:hypothetical protein CALVIDRAFT_597114 [Calocera viscosa TUFC12733]
MDLLEEEACLQGTSKGSLQRQNRPQKLPGPEKPLLPTIIVTPSSPSLRAHGHFEFHHLVYAPPPPPRAPHPLFKPFSSNPKRARWVCALLALAGLMILWHAWFLRSETLAGSASSWDVYVWERVRELLSTLARVLGLVTEEFVEA